MNINLITVLPARGNLCEIALLVLPKDKEMAILVGGSCANHKLMLSDQKLSAVQAYTRLCCACSHSIPDKKQGEFLQELEQQCLKNGVRHVVFRSDCGFLKYQKLAEVTLGGGNSRDDVDPKILEPYILIK